MRVAIFGMGYVGATAAACIASSGHYVVGVDPNASKAALVNSGRSPISEPRVPELLAEAREAGRISAVSAAADLPDDIDLAIVCVGTPSAPDGGHDMSHIAEVTRQIAVHVAKSRRKITVAYRSTFRPGTMETLVRPIFANALGHEAVQLVELVYNPEFLREASAVHDYFNPPKIVIGTADGQPSERMEELHQGISAPVFTVRFPEAEITKFVDNTWHAVKVAFANEVGRVCQTLGISAQKVHEVFVSDTKLNISAYYMRPGNPFGGSCLPKDVRALQHLAKHSHVQTPLIGAVLETNEAHKQHQLALVLSRIKPASRVLLVGLAFKAATDDMRESPNVDLAKSLIERGCNLSIYDPEIQVSTLVGANLGYSFSSLPNFASLMVDRIRAEGESYDLVVAANETVKSLNLRDAPILTLHRID